MTPMTFGSARGKDDRFDQVQPEMHVRSADAELSVYWAECRPILQEANHSSSPLLPRCVGFRNALQDMEDLIELRSAMEGNAGKPGVESEQVKAELVCAIRSSSAEELRNFSRPFVVFSLSSVRSPSASSVLSVVLFLLFCENWSRSRGIRG